LPEHLQNLADDKKERGDRLKWIAFGFYLMFYCRSIHWIYGRSMVYDFMMGQDNSMVSKIFPIVITGSLIRSKIYRLFDVIG